MQNETRNCKEYCRYSRCCYAKGTVGQDPWQCPNAWKIEDILMDSKYEHDDYDPDEEDEE